ncbi:AmmeMemoRadiSam system protein B [Dehalobacter sp. TeCB1]|uniref:AmmeMemoRadiSam system protein B n=1 Tax=Dehalobacter sp. TeCB1 TaxID=1843715 RepID=UPI00083AB907|nr:AmmeMemoRadiSam system protein B [Dehalobacter sp. TeCB1]OCZ53758.1 AmmeMemoRadiSam system protein B [Dehalobacter sp. TeCB1]
MTALLLLCFSFLLLSGCDGTSLTEKSSGEDGGISVSSHPGFITREELNAILADQPAVPSKADKRIVSAVMPHHLTAARLINDLMQILAAQEPGLIILVGPNHLNNGNRIITGLDNWETPEGLVETDQPTVNLLLKNSLASRDEGTLSSEHSIGSLAPLIKHYLPKAKIVPLILHHDVTLQEVNTLLAGLEPCLNEHTVLISSVDFSHYLTRVEAQGKDRETLKYMQEFDYPALFRLGNDYLDSPASLAASFRLAEKQGIRAFHVLGNTNSGILLQNDMTQTTSYFTLVFYADTDSD